MKTRTTLVLGVVAVLGLVAVQPAQAALVAYWNCDEGSGTTVNDYTANNNDGTRTGATSWQAGHTGLSGDYSVRIPSGSNYISVPDSTSFDTITNAFTFTYWAYERGGTNYGHLIATTTNYSARNWIWQTDAWGGDSMYIWSDTASAWNKSLGYVLPDGAWKHMVVTYSGGSMKTYMNGVLKSTHAISGSPNFPNFGGALYLGGWLAGNSSFDGDIDDLSMWNENIGEARAQTMYNITTVNSGALKDYGVGDMKTLFDVYASGTPAWVDGTEKWTKFTGGSGTAGAVTYSGGLYYAYFDGTSGVMTPEPATMALLGLGGLGLILGRKRK